MTISTPADSKSLDAVLKLIKTEVPELALEGLAEALADAGEKPRSRSSKRKTEDRSKPKERSAKPQKTEEKKPEAKSDRGRSSRKDRQDERENKRIVGFGDHVPDFMRAGS